jgi:hypothetical protein
MTNQHPITPPPELVREWCVHSNKHETYDQFWCHIATQAARWGADQELEACCKWLSERAIVNGPTALRAARRPQPPSLKERAQAELDRLIALIPTEGAMAMAEPIRKALEALPND